MIDGVAIIQAAVMLTLVAVVMDADWRIVWACGVLVGLAIVLA